MKKILIVKANYYNLISNKLAQQSINLLKNKRDNLGKIKKLKKIGDLILKKNLNELERIIR